MLDFEIAALIQAHGGDVKAAAQAIMASARPYQGVTIDQFVEDQGLHPKIKEILNDAFFNDFQGLVDFIDAGRDLVQDANLPVTMVDRVKSSVADFVQGLQSAQVPTIQQQQQPVVAPGPVFQQQPPQAVPIVPTQQEVGFEAIKEGEDIFGAPASGSQEEDMPSADEERVEGSDKEAKSDDDDDESGSSSTEKDVVLESGESSSVHSPDTYGAQDPNQNPMDFQDDSTWADNIKQIDANFRSLERFYGKGKPASDIANSFVNIDSTSHVNISDAFGRMREILGDKRNTTTISELEEAEARLLEWLKNYVMFVGYMARIENIDNQEKLEEWEAKWRAYRNTVLKTALRFKVAKDVLRQRAKPQQEESSKQEDVRDQPQKVSKGKTADCDFANKDYAKNFVTLLVLGYGLRTQKSGKYDWIAGLKQGPTRKIKLSPLLVKYLGPYVWTEKSNRTGQVDEQCAIDLINSKYLDFAGTSRGNLSQKETAKAKVEEARKYFQKKGNLEKVLRDLSKIAKKLRSGGIDVEKTKLLPKIIESSKQKRSKSSSSTTKSILMSDDESGESSSSAPRPRPQPQRQQQQPPEIKDEEGEWVGTLANQVVLDLNSGNFRASADRTSPEEYVNTHWNDKLFATLDTIDAIIEKFPDQIKRYEFIEGEVEKIKQQAVDRYQASRKRFALGTGDSFDE